MPHSHREGPMTKNPPWFHGPIAPSTLPSERRQRLLAVVVFAVGAVWLMIPRLYGSFADHLHKEDGLIFLSDHQAGKTPFETYTGYLHLGPRLITDLAALLPPEYFAPCVAACSSFIRLTLAILMFSVLLPYVGRWYWALIAASLPLFGGIGQQEVLGNLTNLRWFLDLGVVFVLLGNFRKPGLTFVASAMLLLGVFSDPLTLLVFPIALWRFFALSGRSKLVPAVYFPAAVAHFLLLERSARSSFLAGFFGEPQLWTQNIVVRGATEAIFGETCTQLMLRVVGAMPVVVVTVLLLIVFGLAVRRHLVMQVRWVVLLLGIGGLLFTVATLNFSDPHLVDVQRGLGRASRYALIPSVMIGSALVVALSHLPTSRWKLALSWSLLGVMALGSLADSRGDSWATHGPTWSDTIRDARDRCSDGRDGVTVKVTPQDVPISWTADLQCDWVRR